MTSGARRRLAATGLVVTGIVVVSGCGGLYDFPTEPGTEQSCADLIAAAPETVLDQTSTPVDSDRVAAWGDPRLTLRCGVTRPEALQPTSRCDDVDGVGWFTEDDGSTRVFTTIGRVPNVSVEVPQAYEPAGAALIDVGDLVKERTRVVDPCV